MPTYVIIIIVVIIIFNMAAKSSQQKRRREAQQAAQNNQQQNARAAQIEAQRRAAAEAERSRGIGPTVRPTVQLSGRDWHCSCGKDNGAGAEFCVKCGRKRAEAQLGSLNYTSSEGQVIGGDTEGFPTEGRSLSGDLVAAKSSMRHAVRPVTESRHGHTESSMSSGDEECVEDYDPHSQDAYSQKAGDSYAQRAGDSYAQRVGDSYAQTAGDAYALDADSEELIYGIRPADSSEVLRGLIYSEILAKPKALRAR